MTTQREDDAWKIAQNWFFQIGATVRDKDTEYWKNQILAVGADEARKQFERSFKKQVDLHDPDVEHGYTAPPPPPPDKYTKEQIDERNKLAIDPNYTYNPATDTFVKLPEIPKYTPYGKEFPTMDFSKTAEESEFKYPTMDISAAQTIIDQLLTGKLTPAQEQALNKQLDVAMEKIGAATAYTPTGAIQGMKEKVATESTMQSALLAGQQQQSAIGASMEAEKLKYGTAVDKRNAYINQKAMEYQSAVTKYQADLQQYIMDYESSLRKAGIDEARIRNTIGNLTQKLNADLTIKQQDWANNLAVTQFNSAEDQRKFLNSITTATMEANKKIAEQTGRSNLWTGAGTVIGGAIGSFIPGVGTVGGASIGNNVFSAFSGGRPSSISVPDWSTNTTVPSTNTNASFNLKPSLNTSNSKDITNQNFEDWFYNH